MSANSYLFLILGGGFFVLVFVGLGVLMIILSQRDKKKAQASLSWPAAMGKIVAAEVKAGQSMEDEDGYSSTVYYPEIRYEYQVGGETYSSNRLAFGSRQSYGKQQKAAEGLLKYPVGDEVTVYYDPANPQEAVLEQSASNAKTGLVVGIILLVIGLCSFLGIIGALIVRWIGN